MESKCMKNQMVSSSIQVDMSFSYRQYPLIDNGETRDRKYNKRRFLRHVPNVYHFVFRYNLLANESKQPQTMIFY